MLDFDQAFLKSRGLIYKGGHLPYNPNLVQRAKQMRQNMTLAEEKIWFKLFRTFPYRVYRQRPIDHFIVDFYCSRIKHVFEIDGSYHLNKEIEEYDEMRTLFLEVYELTIIRFTNDEVMKNFEYVENTVMSILKKYEDEQN